MMTRNKKKKLECICEKCEKIKEINKIVEEKNEIIRFMKSEYTNLKDDLLYLQNELSIAKSNQKTAELNIEIFHLEHENELLKKELNDMK